MRLAVLSKRVLVSLQGLALVFGISSAGLVASSLAAAPVVSAACPPPGSAAAKADPIAAGAGCSQGGSQSSSLFGTGGIFTVVANTLTFIVGAVSVIYIILGGFRYVTSGGDSKQVTQAKDTLLYAVIGVVVAMVSYAVINFVITAISTAK